MLTDRSIRNIASGLKPKKVTDGAGLHLLVTPQGSKLWRLAYRFDGKQKTLTFGAYPTVSLADARQKRDAAKKLLAQGTDPGEHAKQERVARQFARATTFNAVADEYLAKVEREGKAGVTLAKKRWLLDMVRPDFGPRPISDISAAEILVPLRAVEARGNYETARRLRSNLSQVFRYAVATARAAHDPTSGLRGALTSPVVTHRAAVIAEGEFGGLLRAVWGYEGRSETRVALQLMALLYPRPGELRQAEWPEFDLNNKVWTIPSVRTKMRREHRKPLSTAAVELLRELQKLTGAGTFVFPALGSSVRPMSENTLNGALRRLGYSGDEATAHGFRASASSILNESGKWSADAIEAELAHVGADEVRRAYHRAQYWEERVKMAAWWAKKIDQLRK